MAASRLWRTLGLTQPLISVWSEDDSEFSMNDHDIKSLTINRGSTSVIGLQDHTLEVDSVKFLGSRSDYSLHCDLTTHGLDRLNALIASNRDTIKHRYFGRVGKQIVNDTGGIWDSSKWHSSIYCSKWQSQLENSDRVGNQINGEPVMYLFKHFMNPEYSGLPQIPASEYPSANSDYGTMVNDYDLSEAKIPYSEFASRYFKAPGFYVQNTRTGADRVLTLQYRWSVGQNRLKNWLPLTRSQVLSPATWEQPNENRPMNHEITWKGASGNLTYTAGPDPSDARIPRQTIDISYIRFNSEYQPQHRANLEYGADRSDAGYRLPSVTVDLLYLIGSSSYANQRQAYQLLTLEMGDPLFLSGDWYGNVSGIVYASEITEKITADEWTLTFALTTATETVGEWTTDVPAKTWESARYEWKDAAGQWG